MTWTRKTPAFSITALAILMIGVAIFMWLTIDLWKFTADDAFITFRYAYNASRGFGLSFNQLPPRAEGYSSLLWTLIMILPHLANIDVVLFAKITGLAFILGSNGLIAYIIILSKGNIWPLKDRILGAAIACSLFIAFPYTPLHAVSGMETALASFLYTLTALLFNTQKEHSGSPLLPITCFLLGITRPEANLYALVLLAFTIYFLPTAKRLKFIEFSFLFYILPGMIYLTWRYFYYGLLLPLPFYIKSNHLDLSGLVPTISFLRDAALGFTLPLILAIFYRRGAILIPILFVSIYFLTTEHIMGYGNRYYFPFVPILSMLSGMSVTQFLSSSRSTITDWLRGILLFFTVVVSIVGFRLTWLSMSAYTSYAFGLENAHVRLGYTLANLQWDSTPTIAISDAGATPYYSKLNTIDTFGLNEPEIAVKFLNNRSGYVLSKNPTIIILTSTSESQFNSTLGFENTLYQSALKAGYTDHVTFDFGETYFLWVLWKPDSTNAMILDKALPDASQQSRTLYLLKNNSSKQD